MMQHEHTETVAYEGRSYARSYKHTHLFDHEAHVHSHAWMGESRNLTAHYAMIASNVPVTKTAVTVLEVNHA